MPEKWSREKARQFVLEKANNTPMSTTHWKKIRELNAAYEHLFENNFYGHENWPDYLEKEIGVVQLRQAGKYWLPTHPTPESLKSFVTARTKDTPMSSDHWRKTPGLRAVYRYLKLNKYYGHVKWWIYLEKEIGFSGRKN